jgi:hypothetical protein
LAVRLAEKPAPVLESSFKTADREASFVEAARLAGFGIARSAPLFRPAANWLIRF